MEGQSKGIQPRLGSEVEGIDCQESSCHLAGPGIHFLLSSQFRISIKIRKEEADTFYLTYVQLCNLSLWNVKSIQVIAT